MIKLKNLKTKVSLIFSKNKLSALSKFIFSSIQSTKQAYIPKQSLDSEVILFQKIQILTQMIKQSKHPIFFTGAGISTSLGIPDYRSRSGTIIKTGAGLWNRPESQVRKIQQQRNVLIDQLIPSTTHMAIHSLINNNTFKHVVSQNTDGLHLRSGLKKSNLSELHGNRNLQFCIKCQKKYLRDFRTIKKTEKHFKPGQKRQHHTGRHCQNCEGQLHDSIIYFGQKLPKQQLVKSYTQGAKSDLCIAIGSSLTVKPSSNVPVLPLQYQQTGKLVIINIQETPLDSRATLKINGFCDQIMSRLMQKLNIPILEYKIERYLQLSIQKLYNGWKITLNGVDELHCNFSFIKDVKLLKHQQTHKNNKSASEQIQQKDQTTITDLKNKFNFNVSKQNHQNLHDIAFKVDFFGPFPHLLINLKHLIDSQDIIGHQQVFLKIVSRNNGKWVINRTNL